VQQSGGAVLLAVLSFKAFLHFFLQCSGALKSFLTKFLVEITDKKKEKKKKGLKGILSNFAIGHLITFCLSQIGGKKCWLKLNFFVFVEKTKVNFVPRNCDEYY
jgi:hypothetical protein